MGSKFCFSSSAALSVLFFMFIGFSASCIEATYFMYVNEIKTEAVWEEFLAYRKGINQLAVVEFTRKDNCPLCYPIDVTIEVWGNRLKNLVFARIREGVPVMEKLALEYNITTWPTVLFISSVKPSWKFKRVNDPDWLAKKIRGMDYAHRSSMPDNQLIGDF